ncbi:MAG TPA: PP2C family protein-serine/threonine phosphatase [Phycisphaerales bacterium]|nr:PP2C family protein-serine/threonine phosphatase [Phycisphaerales bacterium]
MPSIDTTSNLRIAILMEMLEDLSRAQDPDEAFRAYAKRIQRVRPIDAYALIATADLPPGQYKVTRWFRSEKLGGPGLSATNPWRDWDRLPTHSAGFAASVITQREPRLYQDLRPGADPALGDLLLGMGSCMCVPVFHSGAIAAWSLMFRADPQGYTPADLEDDLLIGNLLASMTRNLTALEHISTLNAALREQLEAVARVQRALLPAHPPRVPGLAFSSSYLPSSSGGGSGGDYFDYFDLGPSRIGVLIADVSGHGPAAATVMAMLHATLHARPEVCVSPALALRFANTQLAASTFEGIHATAILAVIDTAERTVTVARAGHPLPRLRRASGRIEDLGDPGVAPLGILAENYLPTESTTTIAPGDTLVLYTDGITEAKSPTGEQFGPERLDQTLTAAEPATIIPNIRAALAHFTDNALREDDQTLVAIGVVTPPAPAMRD